MNEGIEQPPVRSAWDRVKAVLRFEPGIFMEIAEDSSATGQACGVFALAVLLSCLLGLPFVLLAWPVGFLSVAIMAGLFMLVSTMFAGSPSTEGLAGPDDGSENRRQHRPSYSGWLRAVLFASAPVAFGIVPFVGTFIGAIYNLILQVIAIRDLAGISTAAAVITWLIAMLLPVTLLIVSVMLFGFSMLGVFGLNEVLDWL